MIFITFRSLKCGAEMNIITCGPSLRCGSFISVYLLGIWILKLVNASIERPARNELSLSMQKIAKMRISWRRAAEGVTMAVMAGCGAFLFALMSAKDVDESLVLAVGYVGVSAGAACGISTLYAATKRRKSQRNQLSQPSITSAEEIVDGCSWWYMAGSFFVTTVFAMMMSLYAINLENWTWKVANMTIPLVATCMIMSFGLRPKDNGMGTKFLHFQFFSFILGSGISYAVGNFRISEKGDGWISLAVLVPLLLAYKLGLEIRTKAAQLPPAELSDFLCITVLLGGVGAMAPMIFFSFESVSCYSSNGLESDQCENTGRAAMYLSGYLLVVTLVSLASKAVPREDRDEGLTYKNLAILRLKRMQEIQGALGTVTALASMYLFSVLGVEGDPNDTISMAGGVGMLTICTAALIELYTLTWGREHPAGSPEAPGKDLGGARGFQLERRLSLAKVADDMTVASFV